MQIVTPETFDQAFVDLERHITEGNGKLVFDCETTGFEWHHGDRLFGIGIGWDQMLYYFPFRHTYHDSKNLSDKNLQDILHLLERAKVLFGYNIKFDLHMLMVDGFDIDRAKDTQFMDVLPLYRMVEYTHVKGMRLKQAITRLLGKEEADYDSDFKEYLKTNNWGNCFDKAPIARVAPYCIKDVEMCQRVYEESVKLYEKEHDASFLPEVEDRICRMTRMFLEMESVGVRLDKDEIKRVYNLLNDEINRINLKVQDMVGGEVQEDLFGNQEDFKYSFNLNSGAEVIDKLIERGHEFTKKTPTGGYLSNDVVLAGIDDPLAAYILRHRKLCKYLSTYVEPYVDRERIYTLFNTGGAATGRISSSEPNFQNLPNRHYDLEEIELNPKNRKQLREEISRMSQLPIRAMEDEVLVAYSFLGRDEFDDSKKHVNIRRFFLPDEDYYFISMDFSQMELRVLFYYLENEELLESLNTEGLDIHAENAKRAFEVDENHPKFDYYRKMAKGITFGVIYGLGDGGLAHILNVSIPAAKKYKQTFLQQIGGLGAWFDSVKNKIKQRAEELNVLGTIEVKGERKELPMGYVQTPFGRRMYVHPEYAYKGLNYLVQSMAGEMANESFYAAYKYLKDKKTKSYPAGHIHDEIILMIHKDELYLVEELRELMAQNKFGIPLQVDAEVCDPSWIHAQDYAKYFSNLTIPPKADSILKGSEDLTMPTEKKTSQTLEVPQEDKVIENPAKPLNITDHAVLLESNMEFSTKIGQKWIKAKSGIVGIPTRWVSKDDNDIDANSVYLSEKVRELLRLNMQKAMGGGQKNEGS